MSEYIKIREVSEKNKFIVFNILGDPNTITISPFDINGQQGLSIGYKGEVVRISFDASINQINRINNK